MKAASETFVPNSWCRKKNSLYTISTLGTNVLELLSSTQCALQYNAIIHNHLLPTIGSARILQYWHRTSSTASHLTPLLQRGTNKQRLRIVLILVPMRGNITDCKWLVHYHYLCPMLLGTYSRLTIVTFYINTCNALFLRRRFLPFAACVREVPTERGGSAWYISWGLSEIIFNVLHGRHISIYMTR